MITSTIIHAIITIIVYIIAYKAGERDAENEMLKGFLEEIGTHLEKKD